MCPEWAYCSLHGLCISIKLRKQKNDSAVGSLCSDSKFSEGRQEAQPQTCSGEALIVLCGRQHPGERWKVKWQSLRGSQSPFPGHLITVLCGQCLLSVCLSDPVICPVSRAKEKPKFLMKHLMLVVVWRFVEVPYHLHTSFPHAESSQGLSERLLRVSNLALVLDPVTLSSGALEMVL